MYVTLSSFICISWNIPWNLIKLYECWYRVCRHFTYSRLSLAYNLKSVFVNVQKYYVFRNELISISFWVIYKNYFSYFLFNLQTYFSNLNNFLIYQKIGANSIIWKNLLIPKFFSRLNKKKSWLPHSEKHC